jgi:hypothetical protein
MINATEMMAEGVGVAWGSRGSRVQVRAARYATGMQSSAPAMDIQIAPALCVVIYQITLEGIVVKSD